MMQTGGATELTPKAGAARDGSGALDVSVVIVNWNTRDLLRDCLRSVKEQTRSSCEVFVIDNASSDGSPQMVAGEFPWVRLMANQTNRGFAAANNQGLTLAGGRFVLLLNPDTVILDGAIDRCIAFMDSRHDISCLGCQVLENESTIQRTCFRFPNLLDEVVGSLGVDRLLPHSRLLGGPWMPWWDRRSEREVDVVSGMFMLVRREVLERVGVLDEAYFVYGEEADWCYQMHLRGLKRYFWPECRILHLDGGGKSTSQRSVAMYVQLQRSQLAFYRKNYGLLAEILLRLSYVARMAPRTASGAIRWAMGQRDTGSRIMRQSLAAMRMNLSEPAPRTPLAKGTR